MKPRRLKSSKLWSTGAGGKGGQGARVLPPGERRGWKLPGRDTARLGAAHFPGPIPAGIYRMTFRVGGLSSSSERGPQDQDHGFPHQTRNVWE